MESAMRQRLGKRVWKAILWLLLFSLAGTSFVGILYQVFGSKSASYVLKVNNIGITRNEVAQQARSIQETIHTIRSRAGEYADFILQQNGLLGKPEVIALDRLVNKAILFDAAMRSGINHISPIYAAEKLDDSNFALTRLSAILPTYLFEGYGRLNRAALEDFFRRSPEVAARFDDQYFAALKEDLFSKFIEGMVYIPMISLRWAQLLQESTRTFGVYTLSKKQFIKNIQSRVSKEVLEAFFKQENMQRRYWTPEERSGLIWRFSPESYGIKVSDVALRRYFADRSKKEFKDKTFESVKPEILTQLLKEQFKKLFSIEAKAFVAPKTREAFLAYVAKKNGKATTLSLTTKKDAENQQAQTLFAIGRKGGRSFFIDSDGVGVVVELDNIEVSKELAFDSVKSRVEKDWIEKEASYELEKVAKDLLKVLPDEQGRQNLIEKYSINYKTLPTITGDSKESWENLSKDSYPVEQLKRMGHVGYGVLFGPDKNTRKVVVLNSLKKNEKPSTEGRNQPDSNLTRVMKMVLEKDVLAVLKDSAKIKQYKEEKAANLSYLAE